MYDRKLSQYNWFLPSWGWKPVLPSPGDDNGHNSGSPEPPCWNDSSFSNCSTDEDDYYIFDPDNIHSAWQNTAEKIGYEYIMTVICSLSIILNSLTILVLSRQPSKAPIFFFLACLALADVVTSVMTLPFGLVHKSQYAHTPLGYFQLVYQAYIYPPIANMSETASAWFTVLLGVERLLCVQFDNSAFRICNRHACGAVIIVILCAVFVNIPSFFGLKISSDYQVVYSDFGYSLNYMIYSWFRASLAQFIPLFILLYVNVILLCYIHRSRLRIHLAWSATTKRNAAQTRLTIMLTGTILLFICGNVPVAFAYMPIFTVVVGDIQDHADLYVTYRVITHCLAMLSYALDFVAYCLSNQHFRQEFKHILSCSRRKFSEMSSDNSSVNCTEDTSNITKY